MALAMQAGASVAAANGTGLGSARNGCAAEISSSAWQRKPHAKVLPTSSFFSTKLSAQSGRKRRAGKRLHAVRAEAGDGNDPSSSKAVVAPLELESPVGQFLVSLLQSHPHLFPAAADQQIQQLAADKEAAAAQEETKTSGSELVLYKRIAEVKEQERHKAIIEVIYALIIQKFLAAGVSLIPKIPALPQKEQVDNWSVPEKELESIHSPEVLEVVKDHLKMVFGRPTSHWLEQQTIVQASKLKIGHMYAATVVFGYFLRRLDQRYQLDRTMKALNSGDDKKLDDSSEDLDFTTDAEGQQLAAEANAAIAAMAAAKSSKSGFGMAAFPQLSSKPSKLKSYVFSLDQETLKKFTTLRCKESLDVVEMQTQALFGKPEAEIAPDGTVVLLKEDTFTMSIAGLRRMVLEAVAFGSFLWDVESCVDSNYNLV